MRVAGGLGRWVSLRTLATDRAGCLASRLSSQRLTFTFTSIFHRPFPAHGHSPCASRKSLSSSVAISTLPRCCPHTARVPAARPSSVSHAADPRRDLSPPADSTTPALPAAACDLQPARDLLRRTPLTQLLNRGNTLYLSHSARHTTATRGLDDISRATCSL